MTYPSVDASPASATDDTTIPTPASAAVVENDAPVIDANPADSSAVDVEDAKTPENLLSVIKSAVEKEPAPEASSAPEGEKVEPEAKEEAQEAEPKAEDDANLPFHNHPRWKAVLAERDSFREPAENYGKITEFMGNHGLAPEEVAEGFEIMALLKSGDPVKLGEAREWFSSRLQSLDDSLGNTLPEDLQTRVDEGLIDDDTAQELARTRAAAALRAEQDTARDAKAAEAAGMEQATAVQTGIVNAVQAWEERAKASDPDYAKKAELVIATSRAILARPGVVAPSTPEEAVALAEKALAEVNGHFKGLMPKPRAIAPVPASTSTVAKPAPTSLRGAVAAALAR